MNKLIDNLAVAAGATLGLVFLGVGTVIGFVDRVFDRVTSKFAIAPRKSWKEINDHDSE
jgi:hypothetical protein